MKSTDTLQRFMFEHASIRGEIVHLDDTLNIITGQRDYPPQVRQLLGEALLSCLLLAGSIKFDGEISLQFNGDERLPLIVVQCDNQLNVRACAKYHEANTMNYQEAFLQGHMALTINQYNQTKQYQSIVPIRSTSMADNLMHYFAQSEQIPSKVWLAVTDNMAAGMLLQLMPDQDTVQREQFWEYAVHIGETITADELLTLDNQTILYRLYHETVLRLYDPRPIHFKCRCSEQKMKQVLTMLGKEDVEQIIQEKGQVEVRCEFCNKHYSFDAIDVTLLFHKL